jgi:hypothetical protein
VANTIKPKNIAQALLIREIVGGIVWRN